MVQFPIFSIAMVLINHLIENDLNHKLEYH